MPTDRRRIVRNEGDFDLTLAESRWLAKLVNRIEEGGDSAVIPAVIEIYMWGYHNGRDEEFEDPSPRDGDERREAC